MNSHLEQNSKPIDSQSPPTASLSEPLPPAEVLAATMESIDRLARWLEDTGLSSSAIAHWKYNCLASTFPALGKVAESAKTLIGTTMPMPETGMNVTELATILTESCQRKIKPADVNKALAELGLQIRKEQERVWELTEAGKEYAQALLATSKTNDWSGPQVKWFKSVIPLLEDYFQSPPPNGETESQQTIVTTERSATQKLSSTNSTSEREFWFIEERAKHLGYKLNANHILHIDMYAIDSYKERYGKPPNKQQYKRTQATVYPDADMDILDIAINKVMSKNQSTRSQ